LDGPGADAGALPAVRLLWAGARHWPHRTARLLGALLRAALVDGGRRARGVLLATMPAADRAAVADPAVWRAIFGSALDAARQGHAGIRHELALYVRPWDMDLTRVVAPVSMWHGGRDRLTPPAMARALAAVVPGARLTLEPAEAHVATLVRFGPAILEELAAALG
jgi:pimeloyl-ACP methyl ester carboxylesterase